jgi:hypothetical protein
VAEAEGSVDSAGAGSEAESRKRQASPRLNDKLENRTQIKENVEVMRFRFSIRDLLWLTLLVAVIVAWWLDHRSIQAQIDAAPEPFPGTISTIPVVG